MTEETSTYWLNITFNSNQYPFSMRYDRYPYNTKMTKKEAVEWAYDMAESLSNYTVTLICDGVAIPIFELVE